MSKHVEIFKKIIPPSNVSVVQSQNEMSENCEVQSNDVKGSEWAENEIKRQCFQIIDCGYEVTLPLQNETILAPNCMTLQEYESIESKRNTNQEKISAFPTSKINYETQSTDFIAYFPSNDIEVAEAVSGEEVLKDANKGYATNEKPETYIDVDLHDEHEQQLHSMDIMLADYIQADLLPLETLKELGFCKYNQQLTGLKVDDDTIMRVKRIIDARYVSVKETVTLHVPRLSQTKPYSLSFEIYTDNEEQDVLNIYFNYLNEKQVDLISILYTSCTICAKDVNVSQLLNGINLTNCSGVVVTCEGNEFQFVSDFASIHGWF